MAPLIGVLLNRRILRRAVRGASTFERLDLYAKAARDLDVEVVFFHTGGVRFGTRKVGGYTLSEDGRFKRTVAPLPAAVHKRGLYSGKRDRRILRRLSRMGVYVFNPEVNWDKYRIHRFLMKEPRLTAYLPETVLLRNGNFAWFKAQLLANGEVFAKPRKGSLGLGIARVVRLKAGKYRFESRKVRKVTSLRGAWKLIRKGRRLHLLQRGIPLLEDEGRRVDLRVPVQRDGRNQWQIAGIAAKRAEKQPFLTNLARGGSVHDGFDLLSKHFGCHRAAAILNEIKQMAILVADTLNARHPRLVDLGLDVGVDAQGHPYLIEVNRRDLRILLDRSGQHAAFCTLYKNPLAHARYVLKQSAPAGEATG